MLSKLSSSWAISFCFFLSLKWWFCFNFDMNTVWHCHAHVVFVNTWNWFTFYFRWRFTFLPRWYKIAGSLILGALACKNYFSFLSIVGIFNNDLIIIDVFCRNEITCKSLSFWKCCQTCGRILTQECCDIRFGFLYYAFLLCL